MPPAHTEPVIEYHSNQRENTSRSGGDSVSAPEVVDVDSPLHYKLDNAIFPLGVLAEYV